MVISGDMAKPQEARPAASSSLSLPDTLKWRVAEQFLGPKSREVAYQNRQYTESEVVRRPEVTIDEVLPDVAPNGAEYHYQWGEQKTYFDPGSGSEKTVSPVHKLSYRAGNQYMTVDLSTLQGVSFFVMPETTAAGIDRMLESMRIRDCHEDARLRGNSQYAVEQITRKLQLIVERGDPNPTQRQILERRITELTAINQKLLQPSDF